MDNKKLLLLSKLEVECHCSPFPIYYYLIYLFIRFFLLLLFTFMAVGKADYITASSATVCIISIGKALGAIKHVFLS